MIRRIRQLTLTTTVLIMSYIPFHAFFSTWLISNFGHVIFFKSLKDILVFLVFGLLLVNFYLYKIKNPLSRKLLFSIYLYLIMNIIYLVFSRGSIAERFAGFDVNTRFFSLFLIAYFVGSIYKNTEKLVLKIVVVSLGLVSLFGLLQSILLPSDFLSHFGYNGKIIPSYFTIDGAGGLIRYSSTLRGPNVLGAYLVVAIPVLVSFWIYIRKGLSLRYQMLFSFTLLFSVATLYFTYSRSAWIGLVVAMLTYLFFVFKKYKKQLFIICAALSIAATIVIIPNRKTYFIQQVVFHTDPSEQSGFNSDNARLESLKIGFSGLENSITGHGIGASGTPSTYGDKPVIVENYFLDIAYQFGYLGLILLLVVYFYTFRLLWTVRNNWLVVSLISSLLGLSVIGMLWPVWSDETVAYIWWGLAGVILGKLSEKKLKLK